MDSFMNFCKKCNNPILYFHNEKFDGEFILYWLLTHDFKYVKDKKDVGDNTFTCLISDMGVFYSIEVYFKKGNKKVKKVTFYDSLKIIPFSVEEIAKSFNMEISKLKIDYDKPREKGHILTKEEQDYIKNDVLIVAKALKVIFNEGLTKMTRASNALADYKKIMGRSKFEHYFPRLDSVTDKDIRKSYRGGFTYLNPLYKEKDVENGTILDVNSLYPSVMYDKLLPIGEPIFFEGQYKEDKVYNLYVQMITCSFKLKKNKIPTIQIKNSQFFRGNEYLTSSIDKKTGEDEIVSLVLTNVDLKLFFEQYDVYNLKYVSGWKFRSIKGLFTDYIDKWINVKIEATKKGNLEQRTLAKLMLNSLYGKFAMSLEGKSKIPYLGDDEIVHYTLSDVEERKGLYIPIRNIYYSVCKRKNNKNIASDY